MVCEDKMYKEYERMISMISDMAKEIIDYLGSSNDMYRFGNLKIDCFYNTETSYHITIFVGNNLVLRTAYGPDSCESNMVFLNGDWKNIILSLYKEIPSLVEKPKKFRCQSMSEMGEANYHLKQSMLAISEYYNGKYFLKYLNKLLNQYNIFVSEEEKSCHIDGKIKKFSLYCFYHNGELVGRFTWDKNQLPQEVQDELDINYSILRRDWLIPIRATAYEIIESRVNKNQKTINEKSWALVRKLKQ